MKETRHRLNLNDVEKIQALDALADVVVNGSGKADESIYAYPIFADGQAFHSPTIGKDIYWRECIVDAIPEDWSTVAFLWLISSEHIPAERGPKILKAVKRWGRKSKLTTQDVSFIMDHYRQDREAGGKKSSYGDVIALLVRVYGGTCDHYLEAPEHEIRMLLSDWTRKQEAEAAAMRRSRGKGTPLTAPSPTLLYRAQYKFDLMKAEIRESWARKK
ncbi:MAG: hypothetical protein GY820_39765 [Gammaproteobacteria bacterium]|nr:hypothetical protein [Gammaproteobacteria bacterium]